MSEHGKFILILPDEKATHWCECPPTHLKGFYVCGNCKGQIDSYGFVKGDSE